jgi:anti-sigma B factor antagonist
MPKLTVTHAEDRLTIVVEESRLDAAISTRFKDRIREIVMTARTAVVLDMTNIEFMDSSGLGAVIAVHKAMPGGRVLELIGLTPNVERVFRLTRMDTVFKIRPAARPVQEKRA